MSAHKYLLTTHRVLSFPIVEHAMESSIHPHFDPKQKNDGKYHKSIPYECSYIISERS